MKINLSTISDYYKDSSGEHMPETKIRDFPFEIGEEVYKITYGLKKYKVVKYKLTGIWLEDLDNGTLFGYGYTTNTGVKVSMCQYHQLYTDKDKAIERCLELNNKLKVKVIDKT